LPCGRYGSYEACVEPHFELEHLPLVDRGFVYALAHVRGGGELGRLWHEDGKFLKKRNTFTDFIACAEHLVGLDYTRPELLCAEVRAPSLGGRPPLLLLLPARCLACGQACARSCGACKAL